MNATASTGASANGVKVAVQVMREPPPAGVTAMRER
jgi:hypothetical protein